jgi:hypothetical protein
MPAVGDRTPSSRIDLTRFDEPTRRALYDAVVATHFTPTSEDIRRAAEDPGDSWFPGYSPEAAQLTVFHAFHRWFAVWRALEEGSAVPPERRWVVLRIGADPDAENGLCFSEV